MKKEERARMRRLARWLLPPVLLCAGYALWVGLTGRGPACPIHAALGLWCPLCGASRMGLALLRLDLPGALRANAVLLALLLPGTIWGAVHAVRYVRTGDGSVRRWERALLWGGRGRAAGGRRFAQPAGIRFFGAALSGCVPAQRDFVFYAGSLPFRVIEVMLLFRKAHKYFMLHEQAQGSTP